MVEAQVERTPDAVAVVDADDQELSYRELDRRANRLARHLRSLGAGPETRVAICLERSLELVVALLAILKAGAAYVPLDPSYPRERLAFMLKDSQSSMLLTRGELLPALPREEIGILDLAAAQAAIAAQAPSAPNFAVDPANLAYVIYTSGSTGVPKGVMIEHRATANTLLWLQDSFELGPSDVVAQKTATSFTDSVWELFWPLTAGARLDIADADTVRDPRSLYVWLRAHKVTHTQFVPPQMRAFLEAVHKAGEFDALPHLRFVFNGGEPLPDSLAKTWCDTFFRAQIANIYGMTESAIYATSSVVSPSYPGGELTVLIGRPISNEQVYVLGPSLELCPPPVTGQLFIAGHSLARGYLGRPELTAERFLPDPFGRVPGGRMYMSGDLGHYLESGEIRFVGRVDRQVKIRGYRVELAEVENALALHPGVREAVVTTRDDDHVNRALVGYVRLRDPKPSLDELRAFVKRKLPDYMVPSALHAVDRWPLTASGKIDRRLLRVSDAATPPAAERTPAQTAAERVVASLFSEVLNAPDVAVTDNFFDLGGHSLLAVQLLFRVEEVFGTSLPVRALFEAPTPECLLGEIAKNVGGSGVADEIAETYLEVSRMSADQVAGSLMSLSLQR